MSAPPNWDVYLGMVRKSLGSQISAPRSSLTRTDYCCHLAGETCSLVLVLRGSHLAGPSGLNVYYYHCLGDLGYICLVYVECAVNLVSFSCFFFFFFLFSKTSHQFRSS